MKNARSLASTTHDESFLAFHARAVPLLVLIVVLLEGVGWFIPPPIEGGFKVFNPYSSLMYFGFWYFAYLLGWLVERICKALGWRPKSPPDLSFRALSLRAIPIALAAGVLVAFLMSYVVTFVMSHFAALAWPIWGIVLGVGAVAYSIFVLDWLSHRVYRVAARKLLPAH